VDFQKKEMKTARQQDRASRIAQRFDLLSPTTFVPLVVCYILIILASVLYDHIAAAVVLGLAVAIGAVRMQLVPRHELCLLVELCTLWLAYGLFFLHGQEPRSGLLVMGVSAIAGVLVLVTHLKAVKQHEKLRKTAGLLVFVVLVSFSGPFATTNWWAWRISKATMFALIWVLIQVESQGINIVSGDTYTRSVERKWVHAGWLLWAHWAVALVGVLIHGAYLGTLIRHQRHQNEKKEDGVRDISLHTEAARNEEHSGVARMALDYTDQDEDIEGGSWDYGGEDLYEGAEVGSYTSEEGSGKEEYHRKPTPPASGQGDASSDWDTFSNPDMTTLPPGAEIPPGAIPIPFPGTFPGNPEISPTPPSEERGFLTGTSASRVSGGSDPFAVKWGRRPPSRLGRQTRRGGQF
jgi:hypothetical protein